MPDASTGAESTADNRINPHADLTAPGFPPRSEVEAAPFRFSLRTLLLATAGVAFLGVAFRYVADLARHRELEQRIRNNFLQIELGLLNHEDARRARVPSVLTEVDGNELSSWRWQVVPYMEQLPNDGSFTFDLKARWDAPINKDPRNVPHQIYCWGLGDKSSHTSVFAIAGPEAAFEPRHWNQPGPRGEVPANCILVMEVADSKTHWMQPGDYDVTKLLAATGRLGDTVKGLLKDRIHILFADGEVWALSPDMPIDVLKPFLTITAAKAADRDQQLAPYRVD
jgi:hypothetical protein